MYQDTSLVISPDDEKTNPVGRATKITDRDQVVLHLPGGVSIMATPDYIARWLQAGTDALIDAAPAPELARGGMIRAGMIGYVGDELRLQSWPATPVD